MPLAIIFALDEHGVGRADESRIVHLIPENFNGAEPWWYYVKYQEDVDLALQELRQREFVAGRYNPAISELAFPISAHSPAPALSTLPLKRRGKMPVRTVPAPSSTSFQRESAQRCASRVLSMTKFLTSSMERRRQLASRSNVIWVFLKRWIEAWEFTLFYTGTENRMRFFLQGIHSISVFLSRKGAGGDISDLQIDRRGRTGQNYKEASRRATSVADRQAFMGKRRSNLGANEIDIKSIYSFESTLPMPPDPLRAFDSEGRVVSNFGRIVTHLWQNVSSMTPVDMVRLNYGYDRAKLINQEYCILCNRQDTDVEGIRQIEGGGASFLGIREIVEDISGIVPAGSHITVSCEAIDGSVSSGTTATLRLVVVKIEGKIIIKHKTVVSGPCEAAPSGRGVNV